MNTSRWIDSLQFLTRRKIGVGGMSFDVTGTQEHTERISKNLAIKNISKPTYDRYDKYETCNKKK